MKILWFFGLLAGLVGLVACGLIPFSPLSAPQQSTALLWVLALLASGWTFAGCIWLLSRPEPGKAQQSLDDAIREAGVK